MAEQVGTTIGGVPWLKARPFGADGPTYGGWNRDVLAPLSREHGYCMCFHPFDDLIDFGGLGCGFCDQRVSDESRGAEAKRLRTEATLAAYPWLRKQSNEPTIDVPAESVVPTLTELPELPLPWT